VRRRGKRARKRGRPASANWRIAAKIGGAAIVPRREKPEDQYREALLAYHNVLDAVHLPFAIPTSAELEQIDGRAAPRARQLSFWRIINASTDAAGRGLDHQPPVQQTQFRGHDAIK
jgi:hypothetical protein